MRQVAFTEVFSPLFRGFLSRMYADYMEETKSPFATTDNYAAYVVDNFKFLVRKFNAQNNNEEWNIK